MSNTKIQKILMTEIDQVNKDNKISRIHKARCLAHLVRGFNQVSQINLKATGLAMKVGKTTVPNASITLKRPELR